MRMCASAVHDGEYEGIFFFLKTVILVEFNCCALKLDYQVLLDVETSTVQTIDIWFYYVQITDVYGRNVNGSYF